MIACSIAPLNAREIALAAALRDCAAILQAELPESHAYLIEGRRISVKSALDAANAALGLAAAS